MTSQDQTNPGKTSVHLIAYALFLAAIVGLIANTQILSSRLDSSRQASEQLSSDLESLKKSRCQRFYDIITPDTTTVHEINSGGGNRVYRVHTPPDYDARLRYPVVLSFDGISGGGANMAAYSGLEDAPAITVYPDSLVGPQNFTAWQGAPYSPVGIDDVQFVRDILDTLPDQYCVDGSKTFAVGMSNGGSFAVIAGCELGARIKAVASVSGAYFTDCAGRGKLPSLLALHSRDDRQVPFDGSKKRRLPDVQSWIGRQIKLRGCKWSSSRAILNGAISRTWSDCENETTVELLIIKDQQHGWLQLPISGADQPPGTAGYIWRFFERVSD